MCLARNLPYFALFRAMRCLHLWEKLTKESVMTGPLSALNLAFVHVFSFRGRATRAEFWWVTLLFMLFGMAATYFDTLMLVDVLTAQDPITILALSPFDFYSVYFFVITAIPHSSLAVRRLHDAGYSGFWLIIFAVPLIGQSILLVMFCMPTSSKTSHYGTPKGQGAVPGRGKLITVDVHGRAMQGYATLFECNKPVTQEMLAARKAEISDYYRNKVLKSAPSA